MAREARVVGLRDFSTPSLEAVEHRRSQLWTVVFVVMAGLALALVILSVGDEALVDEWRITRLPAFRGGLVAIILALAAYVLEKERHLRRLTRLLIDERVLTAALSNRLRELATLSTVGKAINSVLTLDEVLDIILSSALELLGGESGSVMLAAGEDHLRVVAVRGNEPARGAVLARGEGVAGRVAADREPLLLTGTLAQGAPGAERALPVDSAMCVPLVNRGELLGVLSLNAAAGRAFTEYDLRALTLFAEHAAIAIANARLYEAERAHVSELLEVDKLKSEFVATVSHELRSPLTSIIGAVATLRRRRLPEAQVDEFLEMIERHGHRLLRLIEEILVAQKAEGGLSLSPRPVDLTRAVTGLARLMESAGRPIEFRVPAESMVLADPESLDQILLNLVDNAFTHGAGPVEVVVERPPANGDGEVVRLAVLDRGPGVDRDSAAVIFDRFARGARAGTRGVGLGLYLVRTLVEAQGGKVEVRERPGGGAVFEVLLPAASQRVAADVEV